MGMSAQDKMLHVANRLGLTSLKDMQGSTRMVTIQNYGGNAYVFKNAASARFL
jgi:hypothetical protein